MVILPVQYTSMDFRLIKKLVAPSFLIVVLSTAFFFELKLVLDQLFFKRKYILIIGILSAPENFQQRMGIRKTWLKLLPEISGSSYFIVGNELCEVPPYDRADPYSCIYKPFSLPDNVTDATEFSTIKIQRENFDSLTPIPGFIGFGFYVRSSIIIKKLGILKELLTVLHTDVQVKLVSAFDNKILASVTFNSELVNGHTLVLSKAIKPVELNADFEAFLKLQINGIGSTDFPNCSVVRWHSQPHAINFIQLWQQDSVMPTPFTEKSCTYLFMNYTILDTENIKQNMSNSTVRLKEWRRYSKNVSFKLKNESNNFNDMLFVDVVDTYRNLSLKMAKFYRRIAATENFHYLLKTDDDSFIDLLRVHDQLTIVNKKINDEISTTLKPVKHDIVTKLRLSKFWWWSFFKEFWKVERSGKWREDQYQSASYPTFPCGGGYVINRGIVDYIVANEHNLNCFQGEDVSLGIWLSALPVIRYKTPKVVFGNHSFILQKKIIQKFKGKSCWAHFKMNKTLGDMSSDLCDWTCSKGRNFNRPLCNKIQLTVENMYETWTEFINKGFL